MSIAVLNQVYDEARRLAVAGSVVARGDFRLKKLIPPLEQAGATAPVFARVAQCAKAVVEGPEEKSAENLLELTSLVSAVLYTQGETGAPGKLEQVESVDLGGEVTQISARLLKPLLEALTNTGSGRLEIVTEAHERGAFRDLRLVKSALNGLDDPNRDVAEYLAEKVLPMYGKAVLPEVRAKFDPKGGKGHPRRLKLMHQIDPSATRDLVKQSLEVGSKDVKITAISCLGAEKEDLAYLVEQSASKTGDVRQAAYNALAKIDDPAAVAVLAKAITGKDLMLAVHAISESKSDKLADLLVDEIRSGWDDLRKLKDKKKVGDAAERLTDLIHALPNREYPPADALALDLFARRAEMAKVKGSGYYSGSDVIEAVLDRMADGPKPLKVALAHAHAELADAELGAAVRAAREALPPAEVYDLFAPYVLATVGIKPGKKDKAVRAALNKRDAILDGLDADYIHSYWYDEDEDDGAGGDEKTPPLDPRWLDLGVKIENLGLVFSAGRPGHAASDAFLSRLLDAELSKKSSNSIDDIVQVMARVEHPGVTEAVTASYEKFVLKKKGYAYTYWYDEVIPVLPKSAIPQLEAFCPKLKDDDKELWAEAIQKLRDKKEPHPGK
jgi:hypothetical protein